MAPGGVPGIAASVVANGGKIYDDLVQRVRTNGYYDALTVEALEVVLSLLGRAKNKAAFRERSEELAKKMLEAGLTIWEDLRGVDLDWLEFKVGVSHFEALAFFRFLDDSAFETLEQAPEVGEQEEDLEEEELEEETEEDLDDKLDIQSATSGERQAQREEEKQQQQQPRQKPRKSANPKPFAGLGASAGSATESGNPSEGQLSVQESVALMARTITEGQLASMLAHSFWRPNLI